MKKKLNVYILSGACGTGKTTISRELAKIIPNSVHISGDNIHDLFPENSLTNWEERLKITWQNILLILNNMLMNSYNVILDYVVEDELQQILSVIDNHMVDFRYIVLNADVETLKERITARGDIWLIERSLYLQEKLTSDENNLPYLYKSDSKTLEQQVADIKDFKIYKKG